MPRTSSRPRAIRVVFTAIRCGVFLALLVLVWINVRPYFPPVTQQDVEKMPPKALAHLAWLRSALEKGAGEDMQALFPEGYFFSYELYGLAWVEVGLRSPEHREKAVREARWALDHIESPKGRSAFPASLPPGHGMFYAGWRNHLHAGIILLSGDKDQLNRLRSRCDDLRSALKSSPAWPWMASYPELVWPCDAPPGIHAMRVFDDLTGEDRYTEFVQSWLDAVARNLDPEFGMITHRAPPDSGKPLGPPRGTSQAIILRFLADIDPDFASAQYKLFQEHFHGRFLLAPAIREYPRGTSGAGDVDSGPLIGGISGSTTVVGMGVAQLYGDHEFAGTLSRIGETIGFPFGTEKRRYLAGVLPVGDAFVVHATTARPWLHDGSELSTLRTPVSWFWRWPVHLLSLFLGLALLDLWSRCSPSHSRRQQTS